MEELDLAMQRRRVGGFITFSLIFIFVSVMTFVATRLLFPIITYNGRGSMYIVPAYLTYIMPLVIFYLILMSMYSKTIKGRLRFIQTLGLILLGVGIFDLVEITLCITLLWDGKIFVHFMTPLFPLDIILFNVLYIGGSICALMYKAIDKKYILSVGVSRIPLKTKRMVQAGFYIPFAAYFFGEFIYSIVYLKEGYLDPNWYHMIPHYIAFLLPTVFLMLYMTTRFQTTRRKRRQVGLSSLIFINASSLITFTWMYISVIINPYVIAESLQWEYELGLPLKYPFGMFITTALCLIVSIYGTVKLIKVRKKEKPEYEQKQEKI